MSIATISIDAPDSVVDPIAQLIETRSYSAGGATIELDQRCVFEFEPGLVRIVQGVSARWKGISIRVSEVVVRKVAGKRQILIDLVHSPIDVVIK